ncbi:MAG: glycosyltransferase family 2 protein [Betaproteobacteria bacterium]
MISGLRIGVVVPCFRVRNQISAVLASMPDTVDRIYVVDDLCPEETGRYVRETYATGTGEGGRIRVIQHSENLGVGGAVISGYRAAIEEGMDVVVKIDGDGQMEPAMLPLFISSIADRRADYTKGNRFFEIESLRGMPRGRLFGNAMLSLINKLTSGYWDIMDPTNGFTAIHVKVLKRIPLDKLENRYFFESDMLFRLGTLRASVVDIPMAARYANEASGLRIGKVLLNFPGKYAVRFFKRLFYAYLLRDFNAGSVQLALGLLLFSFGASFGSWHWFLSYNAGVAATSGTVMLAALPVLLGGHLLIGALNYDIANVPRRCLHELLPD